MAGLLCDVGGSRLTGLRCGDDFVHFVTVGVIVRRR